MTTYTAITGDLFDSGLPAIGHGCNCLGMMNAGIAKQFRRRYPDMHWKYWLLCSNGLFTLGQIFVWEQPGGPVIYNLATQPVPGPTARLRAIETSVRAALADAAERRIPQLGIPRIGAGIGGLNWLDVSSTLEVVAAESPVELVVVTLPTQE